MSSINSWQGRINQTLQRAIGMVAEHRVRFGWLPLLLLIIFVMANAQFHSSRVLLLVVMLLKTWLVVNWLWIVPRQVLSASNGHLIASLGMDLIPFIVMVWRAGIESAEYVWFAIPIAFFAMPIWGPLLSPIYWGGRLLWDSRSANHSDAGSVRRARWVVVPAALLVGLLVAKWNLAMAVRVYASDQALVSLVSEFAGTRVGEFGISGRQVGSFKIMAVGVHPQMIRLTVSRRPFFSEGRAGLAWSRIGARLIRKQLDEGGNEHYYNHLYGNWYRWTEDD